MSSHVATVFVGVCGAAPITLLANVESLTGDSSIAAVIGALSGGGFALWYGWYMTTTTLPRVVKEFRDEADADRNFFRDQAEADRKFFREELALERTARERDLRLIADRLTTLADGIQQHKG